MSEIIDLEIYQLIFAYIFIVILLFIVRRRGISREKEIIISSVRMTLQLILIGYVLIFLLDYNTPIYTIMFLAIMETFAIFNIFKRVKTKLSNKIKKVIAFSMLIGTITCLLYFVLIVIRLSPWYDTRYFIPIAGMLIGNSMTGISLGVTRLVDGMYKQRNEVETALMLGATPKIASKHIVDDAFDSAILPTINSMLGMGIVFLPGMMTGQILSGISPLIAIKYQIAIMLGILGSVALTVIIFVQLGYRTFFDDHSRLVISEK